MVLAISKVTVPSFGFGIKPRGSEDFTHLSKHEHGIGSGDQFVEFHEASPILATQIIGSDYICTSFGRFRSAFRLWPRQRL